MFYIIDANNLAGKLNLLGESDFNFKLIELIKKYKPDKKHFFFLVFDSSDPMGDKEKIDERITVVHTPKDSYYKNADDKILEIAENINQDENMKLSFKDGNKGENITELSSKLKNLDKVIIITDDLEIKGKIENLNREKNLKIIIEGSTEFSTKIMDYFKKEPFDNEDKLSEDDEEEINKELSNVWEK